MRSSAMQDVKSLEQIPPRVRNHWLVDDMGQVSDPICAPTDQPLEASWHDADPNDPALILYTSGTTGFPKGATLSHQNVRTNVHAFNHLCNMRPHDVVLLAVPLFHCFGQNALLNSVLNVGGCLVLQQKFDLNESKRLLREHQVTQLYGVPAMFQLLGDSSELPDLASVKYCFSAAAPLPIQVGNSWHQKFQMPIHEGYGLTETSPFASYNHRDRFVPGSIGVPIDGVEMRIVDPDTRLECPAGELGEIAIRGPNVMLGYWNRDKETKEVLQDGWFYSGDIGRKDHQGYYFIVDRVKDMIAIGGLKVFPAEVERVLQQHSLVDQVAVVGIPDSILGEQVIAFVVAKNNTNTDSKTIAEQLTQFSKQRLGDYKIPRQFLVVDDLPRNPSGKILKTNLRQLAMTAANQGIETGALESSVKSSPQVDALNSLAQELQSAHPADRIRRATRFLQQLVKTITAADQIPDPKQTFIEAGLDSLMMVELAAQLQAEIGDRNSLPTTLVFDYPRICDMSEFLVAQLAPVELKANKGTSQPKKVFAREDAVAEMSEEQALQELLKELN